MNTFNQMYPNQFQQGMNFQQPYGAPAQGFGINPANVFQQIQVTDPMTPEDKALLSNKSDKGLNLVLSDEEIAKAKCPHKNQNGMLTAPTSVPNVVKCTQCHEEIDITAYEPQEIEDTVARMTNILQQIKTFAINLDPMVFNEFMMMLAFLKRTPKLYQIARQNFAEAARSGNQTQTAGMAPNYRGNGLETYNNILSGNIGPMYGNAYNQVNPGMYGYNPAMDPTFIAQQQATAAAQQAQMQQMAQMQAQYNQQPVGQQWGQQWGQQTPQMVMQQQAQPFASNQVAPQVQPNMQPSGTVAFQQPSSAPAQNQGGVATNETTVTL